MSKEREFKRRLTSDEEEKIFISALDEMTAIILLIKMLSIGRACVKREALLQWSKIEIEKIKRRNHTKRANWKHVTCICVCATIHLMQHKTWQNKSEFAERGFLSLRRRAIKTCRCQWMCFPLYLVSVHSETSKSRDWESCRVSLHRVKMKFTLQSDEVQVLSEMFYHQMQPMET